MKIIMTNWVRKISPNVFTVSFICAVLASFFAFPSLWRLIPFHYPDLYPFVDLKGRLAHIEAYGQGYDVYEQPNPLDPLNRVNDKPSITLKLHVLGLSVRHAPLIGVAIVGIFVGQSLYILRPSGWRDAFISILIFCNPAIFLLIERGNDDLVVFIFLFVVPYLISGGSIVGQSFATVVIFLLGLMKYYPLAALISFWTNISKHSRNRIFQLASLVAGGVAILVSLKEYLFLRGDIPSPDGLLTFGINNIVVQTNYLTSKYLGLIYSQFGEAILKPMIYICSILVFMFFVFFVVWKFRDDGLGIDAISRVNLLYLVIGGSISSFCYLTGGNYFYRLSFIFMLMPWVFTILRTDALVHWRYIAWSAIIAYLLVTWAFSLQKIFELAFPGIQLPVTMLVYLNVIGQFVLAVIGCVLAVKAVQRSMASWGIFKLGIVSEKHPLR